MAENTLQDAAAETRIQLTVTVLGMEGIGPVRSVFQKQDVMPQLPQPQHIVEHHPDLSAHGEPDGISGHNDF